MWRKSGLEHFITSLHRYNISDFNLGYSFFVSMLTTESNWVSHLIYVFSVKLTDFLVLGKEAKIVNIFDSKFPGCLYQDCWQKPYPSLSKLVSADELFLSSFLPIVYCDWHTVCRTALDPPHTVNSKITGTSKGNYLLFSKLHSILAVANLLAHNNIS